MLFRRQILQGMALAALLAGCKPQDATGTATASAAAPAARELSLEVIAAEAKGFTVGSFMSANTVYVFFDPQCPHCGHLWESSKPLQKKIKFVWIPVRIINASSLSQGAALLGAADPQALMSEHEASLLAGKGGIAASASVAPELDQAIQRNTQLLTSFGAESVPFIVARSLGTGQLVRREGALDTVALAGFLGIPL